MTTRTLILLAPALAVLVPGVCAGQQATFDSAAPHMVRAAGMPLNDGALPPGTLTVRLVEGAFTRNFADRMVEIEVAGGKVESARTGADGRARFAHLPIGARVRASATVGGERLESEFFEMPAQSGVRILLVAGGALAPPAAQAVVPAAPPKTTAAEVTTAVPLPPPPDDTGVAVIRAVLATATVSVFGFLFLARRPKGRPRPMS